MTMTTVAPIVLAAAIMQAVTFTEVARGAASQLDQPKTVVVRTIEDWRALWKAHTGSEAPVVDFSKFIVVGVFLGSRSTAGYGVQITAVKKTAAGAVVEYIEHVPDPGGMRAQVMTAPYHLVAIPNTIQAVEFSQTKK